MYHHCIGKFIADVRVFYVTRVDEGVDTRPQGLLPRSFSDIPREQRPSVSRRGGANTTLLSFTYLKAILRPAKSGRESRTRKKLDDEISFNPPEEPSEDNIRFCRKWGHSCRECHSAEHRLRCTWLTWGDATWQSGLLRRFLQHVRFGCADPNRRLRWWSRRRQ